MAESTAPGRDLNLHWARDVTDQAAVALDRTRAAVASAAATDDLVRYYRRTGNYAGATFLELEPNDPYTVGPADLLAVTTLSVQAKPLAIRTFTDLRADELRAQLERIDPGWRIETVRPAEHAQPMADLYNLVKSCLGRAGTASSNPWVTASKLCARKRPHLFPVRDNVVLGFLGLPKTYPVDWPVFRALMTDDVVNDHLDRHIRAAARVPNVRIGDPAHRLRHLDVMLWMHARRT